MNQRDWYSMLNKPRWAPPSSVFAPVWMVLYIVITISFGYVGYIYWDGLIPLSTLVPFALNLVFNFLYTPVQFEFKNNYLALLDIAIVWVTLLWAMIAIVLYASWVAIVNIPYLLWVTFATALQFSITRRNGISV